MIGHVSDRREDSPRENSCVYEGDRRKVLTRKFQIIFYLTITCPRECYLRIRRPWIDIIFVHNCTFLTFFFFFFCQKARYSCRWNYGADIEGVNEHRPEKELITILLNYRYLLLYTYTLEIASLRTFRIQFLYSMVKRLRDTVGRCPRLKHDSKTSFDPSFSGCTEI